MPHPDGVVMLSVRRPQPRCPRCLAYYQTAHDPAHLLAFCRNIHKLTLRYICFATNNSSSAWILVPRQEILLIVTSLMNNSRLYSSKADLSFLCLHTVGRLASYRPLWNKSAISRQVSTVTYSVRGQSSGRTYMKWIGRRVAELWPLKFYKVGRQYSYFLY